MDSHTKGRAKRTAPSLRSAHRVVSVVTLMFFVLSLMSPLMTPATFAQDAAVEGDQTVVVEPAAEQPAAPVEEPPAPVEEPAAPIEEPAAPVEEPAAPVEEPAAPVEEPAAPHEPAAPVEEPAAPVEEPAAPVAEEQAADEPADTTSSVEVAVDPVDQVVADPSAATCAESAATSPTIASDLADYAPGSLVTLTGSGWVPGQTVEIFVDDDGVADEMMGAWSLYGTDDADEFGNIFFQFSIPNWFVADYFVTATGECTNATTSFTDATNTTTTIEQSSSTTSFGQQVTFTARVTANDGRVVNEGSVTFKIGSTAIASCSAIPVSGGVATCSVSLAVGTHTTINAAYAGTGGSTGTTPSNSGGLTHTVTAAKANQTITFASLGNKTYGDEPFTVSATASSGLAVSFSSQTLAVCTVNGSTVTLVGTGTCTIRASQAGNATYNAAPDVDRGFQVAVIQTGVDVTASSSVYNGTTNLSAQVVPAGVAGSVAFYVNGSTTAAPGIVNYNPATGVATLGNYSHGLDARLTAYDVRAVFTSSVTTHNGSASTAAVLLVRKADQTVTFTSTPVDPKVGSTYTPVATATGTVTFTASGACSIVSGVVTMNTVGTCAVTANAVATTNYNVGSAVQSISVGQGTTTVTNVTATESVYNGRTTLSATVSRAGSVQFQINGVNFQEPVEIWEAGVATLENYVHQLDASATPYVVTAILTPLDSNYSVSQGTGTLRVDPATTTVTWVTTTDSVYDSTISHMSATVSQGGEVEFFIGTTLVGTATSENGVANLWDVAHGLDASITPYTVTAILTPTSGNYSGSQGTGTLTVGPANTTVSPVTATDTLYNGETSLTMSVSQNGSVEFFIGSTSVGSVDSEAGEATLIVPHGQPVGTYTVTAILTPTNANYSGSQGTGTLTVDPAIVTLELGKLSHTYDGSAQAASVSNLPVGEDAGDVSYEYTNDATGMVGDPIAAGSYTVVATLDGTNYIGSGSGVLVIDRADVALTLGDLEHEYDGAAKAATVTDLPAGVIASDVRIVYTDTAGNEVELPTAAGRYNVYVTLDGANYTGSGMGVLVIGKGTATITLTIPTGKVYDGNPVLATATSDAIGEPEVTIEYFQGTTKVASPTDAGSYDVVATLTGLANYEDAINTGTLVIGKGAATITLTIPTGEVYDGNPVFATATSDAIGSPTVTVKYFQGTTEVLEPTNAGEYRVEANLTGLANYENAAETGTVVIGKSNQDIAFTAPGNKTFGDAAFTISASAPGGMVTFDLGNDSTGCSLDALTATVTIIGAGSCTVIASQGGNGNYNAAESVSHTFSIAKATTTITLANLTHTYNDDAKYASATTSPSGLSGVEITYSQSGVPVENPTNAGSYAVSATLTNDNYTAEAMTGTLVIAKANQTVTITSSAPGAAKVRDIYTVAATGGASGETIEFSSLTTTVCTVSGSTVTMVKDRSCTIRASQAGNTNYNSAHADQTFTVTKVDVTVSAFQHPIDTGKTINETKAGSTIPFKFSVSEGTTKLGAADISRVKVVITSTVCGTGTFIDAIEVTSTSATSFKYDEASGSFHYNWKTSKAPGCYSVTVHVDGNAVPTSPIAIIKTR